MLLEAKSLKKGSLVEEFEIKRVLSETQIQVGPHGPGTTIHTISNPVEPTSTVSTEPPPADGGIPATPTRTKQGARAVVREQDKFLESLHDETVSHGKTLITGKGGEDAAARHAKIVQWHVDRWRPIWNNEKPDGTFFKPQEIKSNLQRLNPVENSDEYQAIFAELVAMEAKKRAQKELAVGELG